MFVKYLPVISKCLLLEGLPSIEIEKMLQCFKLKIRSYKKNDLIVIAGNRFEHMGLLLVGEAVVSREKASGNRVMLDLLKPGDMYGLMVAFSSQSEWQYTVQAQEYCEVLLLPAEKILGECEHLCPWHRTLIRNMLGVISEQGLQLNRRVEYLTIKSMRGKISTYLLEQYNKTGRTLLNLELNRNELAEFLNVSRPSMSREMSRMQEEGIIEFYRESVRIVDLQSLKDMIDDD